MHSNGCLVQRSAQLQRGSRRSACRRLVASERGDARIRASSAVLPRRPLPIRASGNNLTTTPWSGPPARGPGGKPAAAASQPSNTDGPSLDMSRGLAALIAVNALIFAGAALAKLPPIAGLALYNANGAWWQFATSSFVHANVAHLSRNMFLLWIFGSALRREVTGPGVWFTYVVCALGANMAAVYALGAKAKVGTALLGVAASGGVAGVALAALALSARPSLRWIMGAALAVQFTFPALLAAPVPYMPAAAGGAGAAGAAVLTKLLPGWVLAGAGEQLAGVAGAGALGLGAAGGGSGVGGFMAALKAPAMSWLWGAAAGALIVVVLARLPVPPE
ncbi:hypothetical protein CHLRE_11g467648v5 [Chlamydomonas reinhardtii]|uniref:Peptidase S54 rhomboid domain-containing protein n=1 Tax=Chlamydomonas reinhardtii TaxID=3055 RepID=A8JA16_CHLRE|nr:uncharacterized protein CHLRE_11g467648v5 [Chlamydomonas reinhardtii]PNW76506.1 hypothetical protein CHLRE_11g467648v5 [Chlamydomonas reinhardtii]|eukprot:XP_001698805.1 rhomboid-like protein [Chlamydomonas reinhardtii]